MNTKSISRVALFAGACLGALALALCLTSCQATQSKSQDAPKDEKVKVVASFYPMADFTEKIGGDKVEVKTLVPNGTEPHDWEPAAQDRAELEHAQVFVYNGANMEHWVQDILKSWANKDCVVVEAAKNTTLLEATEHEHDHEGHGHDHDKDGKNDEADHKDEPKDEHKDEHKDGKKDEDAHNEAEESKVDPHVWLDPKNVKIELANIRDGLIKADPENKEYYEKNYEKWAHECDVLDQEYTQVLSHVKNKEIVVSHQAFGYLCHAYGLTQVPIEGMEADSEPTAAQMAEITNFCKEHNIKVVFSEELVSPKLSEALAASCGAKVEVLSPVEGLSEEQIKNHDDYFTIMRENLKKLQEALG